MVSVISHIGFLPVNMLLSLIGFWTVAKIYIFPKLPITDPKTFLLPILLIQSFRHLGLMFLSPGAVFPGMPSEFANPAAYGDLTASVLAFAAIPLVMKNYSSARWILWLLTVEGTIDLLAVVVIAAKVGAPPFMGATYWIPAVLVPALLVSHYITFRILTLSRAPIKVVSAVLQQS